MIWAKSGPSGPGSITLAQASALDCVCIPGGTFDFDSSFILPSVADHLQKVADALKARSDGKVFVVAHTDRVGPEAYNKRLSDRRALSTYAFLTGNADTWEQLYVYEHWGLKVVQTILKDQGHDPGNTDGIMTSDSQQAMRDFSGADASTTVANDKDFRAKLFAAYMSAKYATALTDSQFTTPPFTGCGEFNPIAAPNADELANQAPGNEKNRRVVVYVFPPDKVPASTPCALADTGPCKTQMQTPGKVFKCAFYDSIATKCNCETADPPPPPSDPSPASTDNGQLNVRVLKNGDTSTPFVGATVTVFDMINNKAVGKWTTSDQGWAGGFKLPGGNYSIVADSLNDEWGRGTGHVDLPAGKHRGIMIPLTQKTIPPPGGSSATGTLVVKTVDTKGNPVDGIAVTVGSTPTSTLDGNAKTQSGQAAFILVPGDYFAKAFTFSHDIQLVTIVANQSVTITLVGNSVGQTATTEQADPYDLDWDLFNEQAYDDCASVYLAAGTVSNTFGGVNPTQKSIAILVYWALAPGTPTGMPDAGRFMTDCINATVKSWVQQTDAQNPGKSPKIGQVDTKTQEWVNKNKTRVQNPGT